MTMIKKKYKKHTDTFGPSLVLGFIFLNECFVLLSGFLNFQNHLEQLGKILDVQLASLSCRRNQKAQSDPPRAHPVCRSWVESSY